MWKSDILTRTACDTRSVHRRRMNTKRCRIQRSALLAQTFEPAGLEGEGQRPPRKIPLNIPMLQPVLGGILIAHGRYSLNASGSKVGLRRYLDPCRVWELRIRGDNSWGSCYQNTHKKDLQFMETPIYLASRPASLIPLTKLLLKSISQAASVLVCYPNWLNCPCITLISPAPI